MSTPNEELYLAVARGKLDDLKAALAAGADPNAPSQDGPTPLVMAARSGYVDGIRVLVAAGADPGAPAEWYGSPLRHAVAEGHLEAVRALVEAGAPFVSRSQMEGPVLVWADDPDIIRYLVSTGADIEARRAGQTALIMAAINRKHRVAALLLELGADRNASDGDRTAMEWAVANDDAEMVALLSGSVSATEGASREPEGVPTFRYAAPSGQWLEVDGVPLSEEFDYHGLVQRLLAGREALGLQDHYPYDRLERIWKRLSGVLDSLSRAVAECLTDPSALVRSQALMFFRERPESAGAQRIEELAESQRQSFAGVTDPIQREVDLEHGLLAALGARLRGGSSRAADLARRIVLEPGKAEPLLIFVPQEYLLEHAGEIARGTPGAGAHLIGLLAGKGRDWRPLVASAAAHPDFATRLEWHVVDEATRARILLTAQEPMVSLSTQVDSSMPQAEKVEVPAADAVREQELFDRQNAIRSDDQAVEIEDNNLKLALIQALRNKALLPPFDKEGFYRQELEEDYDDCADYNYEVDDRVRDYLLETPITRELAMAVDTLYWSGGQEVQHDVWTYWDGEDDEFDICDLAGIDRFPNLREISVGCQAIEDWSPLARLPRLEVLVIDGGKMEDIGQLLPAPALKRVKLSYVKGKDTSQNQQGIAALRERSVEVEWKSSHLAIT